MAAAASVRSPVPRSLALGLLAAGLMLVVAEARQTPRPLFDFRVSFWNSLHHELHAAVRPRPTPAVAEPEELPEAVRAGWSRAVADYLPLARRSLLFDEGLAALSAALSPLGDDAVLDRVAIAPGVKAALEAAAPGYRAGGWPAHQKEARLFIEQMTPLVERYGAAIAAPLAAAYGARWEGLVPVDVVRDAGPPGNAHTTVRPRAHVTIGAADPRHHGLAGLEVLFHEASHGWDATVEDDLTRAARGEGRVIPRDLWHAVVFFTAGELTRRTLAATDTVYVPYAVAQGMSTGVYAEVWPSVVAAWTPWLDGRSTRAAAATALVRAVGSLPPGPGH